MPIQRAWWSYWASRHARQGRRSEKAHADVARSAQKLLEDVLLEKVRWLHERARSRNLCLAGGVALNCVANGRILHEGPFDDLFVPPAPGDAGGAMGAAALAFIERTGQRPFAGRLLHANYGPEFKTRVAEQLAALDISGLDRRSREAELLELTVDRLAAGKASPGFTDAWSLARVRWARAASWPTRVIPACAIG